jgi:hypothetical protein
LSEIEGDVEVEGVGALTGEFDPLEARSQRLSFHDQVFGEAFLGDSVEDGYPGGIRNEREIESLDVFEVDE